MSALVEPELSHDLVCRICVPAKTFTSAVLADGHRRWEHPARPVPTQVDGGEECAPPPHTGRTHWPARVEMLDARPGRWRRWPYQRQTSACTAARGVADRVLFGDLGDRSARYLFQAHNVDGSWWVYGIRLTEELDIT